MKWLSKFQDGGQLRKIIGSLTSLVKRAQNKDTSAVQQIKAILEDSQAAQLLDMVRQTAPELLDAMESIAQSVEMEKNGGAMYLHSLKCGGKSKKARKTKKAENGQELNAKPARLAKGKKLCPCSLKKVGGRIVEVDCDGNVVWNKQGGQMVIKAYNGLKIGGQTITGFSADNLKTADDIRQMQGAENDIQYYYDPSKQSVMSMKYGANGWENPEVANFGDQNPVFGQGEGQINLWKDGYDLKTGLMPGTEVNRNYGYGVSNTVQTREATASPLSRVNGENGGNFRFNVDDPTAKLGYTPAQMARVLRAERKATYWADRLKGADATKAKQNRQIQKRIDRNSIWGTQYGADKFGETGYVQADRKHDYQSTYSGLRNYRKQTAKASVTGSAPSDQVVASKPAATTTTPPTVKQAPPVSATTPRVKLQNGGWLQKYGNGGQVPKYFFGKLLSKLKRNDDGKVVVDSTPGFIQLPVHQGWEEARAAIDLMPSVPSLQPYTGYNPYSDSQIRFGNLEVPEPSLVVIPKTNTDLLDHAMQGALQDIKSQSEKAEADKKKAAAHNARVKTFYSKMSDSDKRALQDMLKVAGYYKGEVDGLIGLKTLEALRQFQAAQKLTVDSMAGRNTFDALRAATRQTAQPVEDVTKVPGYQQAVEILAKMNAPATVTRTGGPTGGMGLNDVLQGRPVELAVMPVNYGQPDLSLTKMNKQGGWLNKKF